MSSAVAVGPVHLDPKPSGGPAPIVPLAIADPAAFHRAYAEAIAAGRCPLVMNPLLPPVPRAAMERAHTSAPAPGTGHILCTSGTTRDGGVPNAFFFEWDRATANARAHLASIGVGEAEERFLLPTPIWHGFGLVAGMLGAGACRGELYAFETTPDPATILDALEAHAITTLYLNPTLARLLARSVKRRASSARPALPALPALRRVSIGAAGMTRGELAGLMELFPGATFYFTYGLTEMGPRVSTFAAGSAASPHPILREEPSRPVPIGRPIAGVTCTIEGGRLAVKSPYAARDLPSGPDGFLTADAAALLPSGDLEVRGRVDEAIVSGGLNVYAEDVERAALTVPGIARACAVGVPSDLYGEIVVLLCEPEPRTSPAALDSALTSALAATLPPTHLPKAVRFVESLPHTASGKVLRREAKVRFSS